MRSKLFRDGARSNNAHSRNGGSREVYPTWYGKTVHWAEYSVDLDPFIFKGEVEGLLTRLSATALCNVTAGGGVVPTFILD